MYDDRIPRVTALHNTTKADMQCHELSPASQRTCADTMRQWTHTVRCGVIAHEAIMQTVRPPYISRCMM